MQLEITLSQIQLIDLLFRFQAAGILCLIGLMTTKLTPKMYSNTALAVCLAAYSLLAVYWQKVHRQSLFTKLPMLYRVGLIVWLTVMAIFFFVFQGKGVFHDILHIIGMFVLFFIVVDALRDYREDLDEDRRGFRLKTIIIIGVYSLSLTLVELFLRAIKDHWLFSLSNALFMFVLTTFFAMRYIENQRNTEHNTRTKNNDTPIPSPKVEKLTQLMQPEFFCQSELTVSKMADAMALPEHQLRALINFELGFDNFSKFLNSYRIPLVCEQLVQQDKSIPILTHTLNAGFNSIASFNRAFKDFTGVTPTDYRKLKSKREKPN